MTSDLTRQHILAFAKHFTSDRHLCWLHSKKNKFSTSTAVQYTVIVWCGEYSKYTVQLLCFSPGQQHNFYMRPENDITRFGLPYDYESVMHFGPLAFSRNEQRTIEPKVSQKLYLYLTLLCTFSVRNFGSLKSHKRKLKIK